jgi:hypothetical protein
MAMRRFGLMTALLATKAAFCSPPDACSLTSTVTDAKLTLSVPDARTSFREGEIIPQGNVNYLVVFERAPHGEVSRGARVVRPLIGTLETFRPVNRDDFGRCCHVPLSPVSLPT